MREDEGRLVAGRYRLRDRLGSGGMGTVWRAVDEFLEREVAVKEVTAVDTSDPGFQRTLREARTSARLRHPGVVTVHDVVMEDGRPWLVMEMVDGHSLAEVVERDGPLPAERAVDLARQLLAALAATHGHGIVHRDVKPANVLLDGDRAVLADFGIAAFEGGTALTATNLLIGSPQYLAPERINGSAGPASDLWSLGVTLYFAVTGATPFQREDAQSVLAAVLTQEPPPVSGPLGPVIEGLLRKDPAARLTTDAAVALLDAAPNRTRPIAQDTQTRPVRPVPDTPTRLTPLGGPGHQLVVALAVVIVLIVAAVLWVGWPARTGGKATPTQDATTGVGVSGSPTFDRMTARGKVIIGVSEDKPGLGYRNPADGSLTGFEIEIATLVAAGLGFDENQVTFTPVDPTAAPDAFASGAVDMVVNTYMISQGDRELVGFAGPYLATGMTLLVRQNESAIVNQYSVWGHRVCLARGTLSALEFLGGTLTESQNIVLVDSWPECVDLLRGNGVDAVAFTDARLLAHAVAEPDRLRALSVSAATVEYGIALPRGDNPLRDEINGILTKALDDGTWRSIYDRTLGGTGAEPAVPTVGP